jgi:hypothetical protein
LNDPVRGGSAQIRSSSMLTIKHIEANRHESVCGATHISVSEVPGENRRELTAFGVGAASVSDDDCNRYANGNVYVMNENGKTVGIYALDC